MVSIKVDSSVLGESVDLDRIKYYPDRRIKTKKAADEAERLAELVSTAPCNGNRPNEDGLFVALQTCGYQATRRAWRGSIDAGERNVWAHRWKAIRDYLIGQNLGLAFSTLARFHSDHRDFDDLRSEALLTLVRAAEGFNPWLGFRFSTYACNAIVRSLIHVAKRGANYRLRVSVEPEVYQDTPVREDRWTDLYADRLHRALGGNVGKLTERESMVLAQRFPMDGGFRMSLSEIGNSYGLSKERVRQIQNSALDKLRTVLRADPSLQ